MARTKRVLAHERLLGALYAAVIAALLARGAVRVAMPWALLAVGHAAVVAACVRRPSVGRWRARLAYGVLLMNLGYAWTGGTAAALARQGTDAALASADRWMFGDVLALRVVHAVPAWASEPLAFCYALLFPYVAASALRHVIRLRREPEVAQRFFVGLLVVYGIGFAGYVLTAAHGPYFELAGTFAPDAHAGPFTRLNDWLERNATNGVDAFPSLHVAASVYTLLFDRRVAPRRAALWLVPVAGLCVSTLFFGFHYGVDVVAGAALALLGLACAIRARTDASALVALAPAGSTASPARSAA